jgi:predicted nuclease of predicted toxin-antitoxin system
VRLLADESCDYRVVIALREVGHDVPAILEVARGVPDHQVLAMAQRERRVVLTEDKGFPRLFLTVESTAECGLVLIRCPERVRPILPGAIAALVARFGETLFGSIAVWTPRGTRLRRL